MACTYYHIHFACHTITRIDILQHRDFTASFIYSKSKRFFKKLTTSPNAWNMIQQKDKINDKIEGNVNLIQRLIENPTGYATRTSSIKMRQSSYRYVQKRLRNTNGCLYYIHLPLCSDVRVYLGHRRIIFARVQGFVDSHWWTRQRIRITCVIIRCAS